LAPRKSTHRSKARFIARTLKGAVVAPFPGFVEPQLATLRDNTPPAGRHVFEIKFDGYRMQLHIKGGKPSMYTRSGLNWTPKFQTIADAGVKLPVNDAILDGEVVVQDAKGRSRFGDLQADIANGRLDRMRSFAFDLLHLDGFDIRGASLLERKNVLAGILQDVKPPIQYSEHFETDGKGLFQQACELGLEGLIAKAKGAPYRSGRMESWLKVKCIIKGTYHVVGFLPHPGAVGALYLAKKEGREFRYVGKAGTGFTRKVAAELRQTLNPFVIAKSPVKLKRKDAVWVEPKFKAEVEYRDITNDGHLRHTTFKRLMDNSTSVKKRGGSRPS
jgi:bifunctional non-homologous end joining protein LigD